MPKFIPRREEKSKLELVWEWGSVVALFCLLGAAGVAESFSVLFYGITLAGGIIQPEVRLPIAVIEGAISLCLLGCVYFGASLTIKICAKNREGQ